MSEATDAREARDFFGENETRAAIQCDASLLLSA